MPKRLVATLAVVLLAANLFAGDPWKDKSYKQWDEKDIRRVLMDSPWAKEVRMDAPWRGSGGRGMAPGGPVPAGGGGYGGSPAGGMPTGGAQSSGRASETDQEVGSPQAIFVVRWVSSRTVREAMARGAVLRGTPEAEAEQLIAQDVPEYVLVVLGTDMTPFVKADENALKGKSYLLIKKTKAKFAPTRVEIQHPRSSPDEAAGASGISAVVFYFAKKTPTGEPALAASEKSAEFVCEVGGTQIKTSFELQKMAGPQGPDW